MPEKITNGSIKKYIKQNERQEEILKQESDSKIKQLNNHAKNEILGSYKKIVIDSFVKVFANNYGEYLDYDSLIQSLSFSIKDSKNGPQPLFTFNESGVKFQSDINKECRKFNENSYSDFVSNESTIKGENISAYEFDNLEEYEAYEQGDMLYSDLSILDGQFIPTTTDADRFGEFNKINKLVGYTPTGDSGKEASQRLNQNWNKVKNKVLLNTIKKFKL